MDAKEKRKIAYRNYAIKNKEKIRLKDKKWRDNNKEKIKNNNRKQLLKKFGITEEIYQNMLKNQNESCAICEVHYKNFNKKLHIDHCHIKNKVRGLLCVNCNNGLGLIKDSKEVLLNLIEYLEK